jgi:hypothetical protein
LFFAHNPIGVTYDRLPAMLTNTIHIFLRGKEHAICLRFVQGASKALRFNRIFIFDQETSLLIRPIDEGNYHRFLNFCKRFLYNTPFVTFMALRWTAVKIDKEKGKKWSGVSKDGLVYVFTTERVSKYNKMAAK